jgi:hypothetical protein
MIIGIYSIFIGRYTVYYKDFIENISSKFMPNYKKNFYIVTDADLPVYNENTVFYKTELIGWPYETLYRFKYFLQFKSVDADVIYFLNANICCMQPITDILPDERKYVFTEHHGQRFGYGSTFEKNSISTACVPYVANKVYNYIGGGFFGATKAEFIELCKKLDANITTDEKNGYIALWHDESHLNNYCNVVLNNNVRFLDMTYHIPGIWYPKYSESCKLLYFDKNAKMNVSHIKGVCTNGKIIKNRYNGII